MYYYKSNKVKMTSEKNDIAPPWLTGLIMESIELDDASIIVFEPLLEKTNNLGFWPGPAQTGLYSHRSRLEAWNFACK